MFNKDLIAAILDEKGWSRYKLCKEANLAQSTLSDILSGKNANPRMDTIQKIATALDVDVNAFFDNTLPINENDINKWDNKYHNLEETDDDFDEETRAIARDMKNLSSNKKQLLHNLIKTMIQSGDDELKK